MTPLATVSSTLVQADDRREWLEADGLGGFASGTTSTLRTRRYHALLLTATTPPAGRMALVNGLEAWVTVNGTRVALTTSRYAGGVEYPDGNSRLTRFEHDPWPQWTFTLPDGSTVVYEAFVPRGRAAVVVTWRRERPSGGAEPAVTPVTLEVRLMLSGRDYHALHHENPAFRFEPDRDAAQTTWRPYPGVPPIHVWSSGTYSHAPEWYRQFFYTVEEERGLEAIEDLASPGVFAFDLSAGEALMICTTDADAVDSSAPLAHTIGTWRTLERGRRSAFASPLARSADAYIVRRGADGRTVIAGYPWFADWGRDAAVAVRGLLLIDGEVGVAAEILATWAGAISEGMIPNRFADAGETAEYNAVDASLWFVVACGECLASADADGRPLAPHLRDALEQAVLAIVGAYDRGTRFGIRRDADALLACGVPGVQLTWMDARVGGRVVTPRIGKPVEVQALWVNALAVAATLEARWRDVMDTAAEALRQRFWNEARGCLFDVVDEDHVAGRTDATLRPNQILAVGGLPVRVVGGDRGRRVVDVVRRALLTPLGLRSLAPGEPGYRGSCAGTAEDRDEAYHQGAVWPWLIGPFVDAALATSEDPMGEARALGRDLQPLVAHLDAAGLGHVSEIADGEPPFTPRGCPFQAWSLGELRRARAAIDRALVR
jgi:predicted glycogen debranching enzyme